MSQGYRWGKPRKNIKRRDPRYFLNEASTPDQRYVDDPEHQTRVEGTTEMFEVTGIPKELASEKVEAMLAEIFQQLRGAIEKAGFNPRFEAHGGATGAPTFEFSRITGQADERALEAVLDAAVAQLKERLQTSDGLTAAARQHRDLVIDNRFLQAVVAQLAQLDWSPVASSSAQVRHAASDARSA